MRILGYCSGAANDRWNYYLAEGSLAVIGTDLCAAHQSSSAFARMGDDRLLTKLLVSGKAPAWDGDSLGGTSMRELKSVKKGGVEGGIRNR